MFFRVSITGQIIQIKVFDLNNLAGYLVSNLYHDQSTAKKNLGVHYIMGDEGSRFTIISFGHTERLVEEGDVIMVSNYLRYKIIQIDSTVVVLYNSLTSKRMVVHLNQH